MFDWRKRVQILRAENALRDGRLDEAFAIASEKELREWRGCQVLLSRMVDPLLDRAALHLAAGRLTEALADVERAQAAGGGQPRVAELRGQVRSRLEERRREETRERDLLSSARRHLARGSVGAGKALLEEVATADPQAARLKREADHREEEAREACRRAEALLDQGALLEAMRAARDALRACARHEQLPPILLRLKAAVVPAIGRALDEGTLAAAEELHTAILTVCGESMESRRQGECLALCREAADALESGRHEEARSTLIRLRDLLPGASWLGSCEAAMKDVADGLRTLRAGPLASLPAGRGRHPGPIAPRFGATAIAGAGIAAEGLAGGGAPGGDGDGLRPGRFLLWVDGVGSYLVLASDRVTIGRTGSSARPDLALAADIAGVQAEVVRVDDDYFIAAHGAVQVNGRKVDRKLLADGDRIALAPPSSGRGGCELVFRLPTALSSSAVLSLSGGRRIAGDAREVILLHRHLLLGPGEGCHVRAGGASSKIVISADPRGLLLRAEEVILIDGRAEGNEALARAGAQIKVGEMTFTITPVESGPLESGR